jgi:hypothetical protein
MVCRGRLIPSENARSLVVGSTNRRRPANCRSRTKKAKLQKRRAVDLTRSDCLPRQTSIILPYVIQTWAT